MIALYKEAFQTFAVLCGLKKLKTTFSLSCGHCWCHLEQGGRPYFIAQYLICKWTCLSCLRRRENQCFETLGAEINRGIWGYERFSTACLPLCGRGKVPSTESGQSSLHQLSSLHGWQSNTGSIYCVYHI